MPMLSHYNLMWPWILKLKLADSFIILKHGLLSMPSACKRCEIKYTIDSHYYMVNFLQSMKNRRQCCYNVVNFFTHDDVIKWKHFPHYWPFVRRNHRSPVNYPHNGQWHGALMFSVIWVWINGWVNNRKAGDLRRNRTRYDVIAMKYSQKTPHSLPVRARYGVSFVDFHYKGETILCLS